MKRCIKCGKTKEFSEFHIDKMKQDGYNAKCKECIKPHKKQCDVKEYDTQHYKEHLICYMAKHAERKAKYFNIPCTIIPEDIVIPSACPIFKFELKPNSTGKGKQTYDSPILDRIVPELGYVKDNIWVISQKASRLKGEYTLEQLKQFNQTTELQELIKQLENKILC